MADADLDLVSGTFIGKDNAFNAGFVAGLGVDWAVTPSIFLRAEWEYRLCDDQWHQREYQHRSSWRECALLGAPFYCPPSPTGFTTQFAKVDRGRQVAYLRQWDTPPQRGAPIWKDR